MLRVSYTSTYPGGTVAGVMTWMALDISHPWSLTETVGDSKIYCLSKLRVN